MRFLLTEHCQYCLVVGYMEQTKSINSEQGSGIAFDNLFFYLFIFLKTRQRELL